jgi:hypothetical protein
MRIAFCGNVLSPTSIGARSKPPSRQIYRNWAMQDWTSETVSEAIFAVFGGFDLEIPISTVGLIQCEIETVTNGVYVALASADSRFEGYRSLSLHCDSNESTTNILKEQMELSAHDRA